MNVPGQGADRAFAGVSLSFAAVLISTVIGVPATAAAPSGVALASQSVREARQFWTPARMRRAKPLEVEAPDPSGASFGGPGEEGASPHRVLPRAPRSQASASSAFEPIADPAVPEARQNGVIFFVAEGGLDRCSGTSVNAPNFSVVFTAAHCVNGGGPRGDWYARAWVFVPGYRYGQRPFGVFPAKWIGTTRQWRATGSENFDVAAAVVERNERGQRLAGAVGGAGIAWGLKARQVFDVHGYPAAPPFDGETQRLCAQTPFLGHDPTSFLFGGPLNLAVDCDVTGGASGGGWTIGGGLLNSVTDYGYPDDLATDYGAYFGKEVARLYARAGRVK
jgi:hypothetical protein